MALALFRIPLILLCIYAANAGKARQNLEVRLVGGQNEWDGRVEVRAAGSDAWGTVCDDNFGTADAKVVCRMLGREGAALTTASSVYGEGSGTILLDDVDCTGNESTIADCTHPGLGVNNCGHGEDVGVACLGQGVILEVRLVGGENEWEGRVEVRAAGSGAWGTVCDDSWSNKDSNVVCRMLGREGAALTRATSVFGEGSGIILLDNVDCQGSERNIGDCTHAGLGVNNCGHSEDVGVTCLARGQLKLEVRLVGGENEWEGRVEVRAAGSDLWGTVCDDGWGDAESRVVCRMLGREGAVQMRASSVYGEGNGTILLDNVDCTGKESSISDCTHNGLGVNNCGHSEDVGVTCFAHDNFDYEVSIAAQGLFSSPGGRLRVRRPAVSDDWSSVCADGWSDENSAVACRMLGTSSGSNNNNNNINTHVSRAVAQSSDTIQLTSAACVGDEASLKACPGQTWGANECNDANAVHLTCNDNSNDTEKTAQVRLSGGTSPWEGTVEVRALPDGEWGSVCDDSWDDNDAKVICRMLGMEGGKALSGAFFGQGTGTVYVDDVQCQGDEGSIVECAQKEELANCGHSEDAGVICTPSTDTVLALLQSEEEEADDNPVMQAIRQAITLSVAQKCA